MKMKDYRLQKLAKNIVQYSISVQPGEKVLLQVYDIKDSFAITSFIEEIHNAGGLAFIDNVDYSINRSLQMRGSEEQFLAESNYQLYRIKEMDAVIQLLGERNVSEYSDIPSENRQQHRKAFTPVIEESLKKKWVICNYPTYSYAQLAGMSLESYANFLFETSSMDYSKMSDAMDALVEIMNQTSRVRIVAPNTDLSFTIEGMPAIKCAGKINLPDGEVFTAPVKDSVHGIITFNTKSIYNGHTFDQISFEFENGKIMNVSSSNNQPLLELLDSDEGARYIGEFAIGLNPYINKVMNDIAFDEKINGSIHLALGDAYEEADNGNKSTIHWDIVLLLKPEFGGGEIYFDDVLVSKDGRFVIESLYSLNPENLRE
jgi:aminopeptidase